ncbi:AraC family transcriptional regulator [Myroides odoratus]|uniref:helix-turn-helix transcriptional regulator n=1 Tax=Myroides odoratus TaxID=256 RepID=UPI00333F608E
MFWILIVFLGYFCLCLDTNVRYKGGRKMLGMCCGILVLNVILYGFELFYPDRPCIQLSIAFFFLQGFGLVQLLKISRWNRYLHIIPFVLFGLLYLLTTVFDWTLVALYTLNREGVVLIGILSFCYANYGYWCLIKGKFYKTLRQFTAFYVTTLYCTAIVFLIIYFYKESFFEYIRFLFLLLSGCLFVGAFFYEVSLLFYTKKKRRDSNDIKQLPSMDQRLFEKIVLDVSGLKTQQIDLGNHHVFNQIAVANFPVVQEVLTAEPIKTVDIRGIISTQLIDTRLFLSPTLTLDQLADILQLPKSDLTGFFKESQALTFKQYINRLKVEYAILLIREREESYTVEELSLLCGFNTRLSFYRAFVDVYGFAPSEILA